MSLDSRLADMANARARLAAEQPNPADNDFEGHCIQCLSPDARELTLFVNNQPAVCNAFCSFECAEMFAFERANAINETDVVDTDCCEHDVRDGDYCEKCREEFLAAAQAAAKGGAA